MLGLRLGLSLIGGVRDGHGGLGAAADHAGLIWVPIDGAEISTAGMRRRRRREREETAAGDRGRGRKALRNDRAPHAVRIGGGGYFAVERIGVRPCPCVYDRWGRWGWWGRRDEDCGGFATRGGLVLFSDGIYDGLSADMWAACCT
jgi:hypothetical protein